MTLERRYGAGLLIGGIVAAAVVAVLPAAIRGPVSAAVLVGFLVQAPLGWLLIRAYGKGHFLHVWGMGIATRFMSVLLLAFLGDRAGFPQLEPLLLGLVTTLFCLLMVEGGALLMGEAE